MPLIIPYSMLKTHVFRHDPTRGIPCVYKYYIPNECIYIGLTTIGIKARNSNHITNDTFQSILRIVYNYTLNDLIIVIHRCKDVYTMQLFEKKLIRYYQPRCNDHYRSCIPDARRVFNPPRGC